MKDGVSLGDACRIPGSARTRISTQRNGCDSCQCNDLKRRCHTLSLFLRCSCSRFQIPSLSNVTADQTSVRHMVQYGYESSSSDEPSCHREKLPREGRNVMENVVGRICAVQTRTRQRLNLHRLQTQGTMTDSQRKYEIVKKRGKEKTDA